jgi:phosphoribosyl 1,2-cyclic phosphodiesterase
MDNTHTCVIHLLELIQKHEKKFNTHHSHANNYWFGGL